MDPQATLRDLLDALAEKDWDRVTELSDSLLHWMDAGGFPPETLGKKTLGTQWHRDIATFLCRTAAARAKHARKQHERKGGA